MFVVDPVDPCCAANGRGQRAPLESNLYRRWSGTWRYSFCLGNICSSQDEWYHTLMPDPHERRVLLSCCVQTSPDGFKMQRLRLRRLGEAGAAAFRAATDKLEDDAARLPWPQTCPD